MSLPTNLSKPYTMVAGTDALAADVNGDFDYVVDELNDTNEYINNLLDTDGTLSANSDSKVATQKATKTYIDGTAFATALPNQTGNAGKFVSTDGSQASWEVVLPDQTDKSGMFLTTDGTNTSWGHSTLVQVVKYETGELASGTTLTPNDNTIPQITEGDQYLTATITPKSATNVLKITAYLASIRVTVAGVATAALFQGNTANAIACSAGNVDTTTLPGLLVCKHVVAGTTDPITFTVRCGTSISATLQVNRQQAGIGASHITIEEYIP